MRGLKQTRENTIYISASYSLRTTAETIYILYSRHNKSMGTVNYPLSVLNNMCLLRWVVFNTEAKIGKVQ